MTSAESGRDVDCQARLCHRRHGDLLDAETQHIEILNLDIPVNVPGVDKQLLNPRSTWSNPATYDTQAGKLATQFVENFRKYDVSQSIVNAGPRG